MEKRKIVLKSTHPSEYPDLVVECKVIPNDKIGEYLNTIPDENKFYAHKSQQVKARIGTLDEVVKTTLKTTVDGKEYILSETENTVRERTYKNEKGKDVTVTDVVVINYRSTSNEEYVVKHQQFIKTYEFVEDGIESRKRQSLLPRFVPKYDSRLVTKVDENVIIITAWKEPVVCLAGGYIVTYDEATNDYNAIEKGAFDSTYTIEKQKTKKLS